MQNTARNKSMVISGKVYKLKPFCTPFSDYSHRNGQNFEVLRPCAPDETDIEEVGPMYWIRFLPDGKKIAAYPEEIFEGYEFHSGRK